eukprot:11952765-Heterocapsa_arctica.AAC.1
MDSAEWKPGDAATPPVKPWSNDSQTTLAAAHPGLQKRMLGQHVFPHVEKMRPKIAPLITGMLLSLDNII